MGTRSKGKREARTAYGGYRERIYTDTNIPSTDDKGARPKEYRGAGIVSDGHWKTTRPDIKHTSMEVSRNEVAIHQLSVRLYDILDWVGASAEFRKLRQDCAISREILKTINSQLSTRELRPWYIFGSSSEGTTTPGLNSDIDMLTAHDYYPVIGTSNISDASDGHALLLIRDQHTQPGYVKLQIVCHGQPKTVYFPNEIHRDREQSDSEGRICLTHMSGLEYMNEGDERNGPADTSIKNNIDIVSGFRYSKIPEFSKEWIVRKRPYQWPSKRLIDKMRNIGCFVVGVGHPISKERNIQWRLSFSLQEREMMFSMNLVQHKCYIVLKIIKKDLIEPIVGKSISSYHLKTCMFHTMENTKSNVWKKRNLFQCVLLCLNVLLKWVIKGYCPNYFIKEENMFDRDLHRSKQLNLIRQINVLLSSGCGFIFTLKLDQIGTLLKYKTCNVKLELKLNKTLLVTKLRAIGEVLQFNVNLWADANTNKSTTDFNNMIWTYLSSTTSIKDHTEKQTQNALSYIIPFVHLRLAQSFASLAFNTHNIENRYALLEKAGYHLRGSHCDLTSSSLLQATVFYHLGQYETCVGVLNLLETKYIQPPLSMCSCNSSKCLRDEQVKQLSALSVLSIISRITTCVKFGRSDMFMISEPLQYEMYRSINTPPGSRHRFHDKWFDLAVVDAVVYLHFMQYLVHAKLNKLIHKHLAIHKLESVLQDDSHLYNREAGHTHLYHHETGYNLLGWIHFREGWIQQGIKYFKKSWSMRPNHNAAKFHIMFILFMDTVRTCTR